MNLLQAATGHYSGNSFPKSIPCFPVMLLKFWWRSLLVFRKIGWYLHHISFAVFSVAPYPSYCGNCGLRVVCLIGWANNVSIKEACWGQRLADVCLIESRGRSWKILSRECCHSYPEIGQIIWVWPSCIWWSFRAWCTMILNCFFNFLILNMLNLFLCNSETQTPGPVI